MTITQDLSNIDKHSTYLNECIAATYSFSKVHFFLPSQLSSSSTPQGENESIDADDGDDDDVQEAATAFINASVYTPMHNELSN